LWYNLSMETEEKPKAPVYRDLNEEEVDTLFAFFDKHNGKVTQMVLDKDCQFHSNNQIGHYRKKYNFDLRLAKIREERAQEVVKNLNDSKIRAIETAQKTLEPRHQLVFSKGGAQVFDEDGNPLIIENLPDYKELKVCWEIIKTELGESTQKADINLEVSKLEKLVDKIVEN